MASFTLTLEPVIHLTQAQFYQLCQANPDFKLERTATGELVVMPPTGGETGKRNLSISGQLWLWNEAAGLGEAFDSSTGFTLPNSADRSPDAAWVDRSRWQSLTPEAREGFVPLCPDFVIELLSPSDRLKPAQAKMREYIENGCRLGWLLNRKQQEVEIYRPDRSPEVLKQPGALSGEGVLPGFSLSLKKFWT